MLRTLRVQDLAIIEELELTLEPSLNVITGETGAGKSILLQALDVVLGGRPDADLVRTGAEEAVIEALFTDVSAAVQEVLTAAGMPAGPEVVLRRVIAKGGRTRAYVNGNLGSLALLRDLAPHLVCAYGQDEHQALRRVESHRELLDAVGGLEHSLDEMRQRYARLTAARDALAQARSTRDAALERTEVLQSQLAELERTKLVAGEEELLSAERSRLVHADRLATMVTGAEVEVYSGEGAAVECLGRALATVREAERIDPLLEGTRRLLEAALAELEEAGSALGRYQRALKPDPERLEAVEDRLATLARLQRKHGVSLGDLIRRREELATEIAAQTNSEAVAEQEAAYETARRAAVEWAGRLSVDRRRAAHDLARQLVGELQLLALEGVRFTVKFGETEGRPLGPEGWDDIEFFISTNAGEEPRSLAKVASGGELSRIMLAVKSLAAQGDRGTTLLFDEVDAGIGGAVAEVVGRKLRQLGRARQVLCITHLPLIAAFAEHHVAVTKRIQDGRTVSTARPLSTTERVTELARMLGGAQSTQEVREHAEALLRQATARPGRGQAGQSLTERAGLE
jgi:DNA repair protein RecN (Recombination protein N)